MMQIRTKGFFWWYAVGVLCVGASWRIVVAWSVREAVALCVVTLVIGLLPYVALARLSRTVRSALMLIAGVVIVLVEDVRVKLAHDHAYGARDDVALVAYPLAAFTIIVGINVFISAINGRRRR